MIPFRRSQPGDPGWSADEHHRDSLKRWRKRALGPARWTLIPIGVGLWLLSLDSLRTWDYWLGFSFATVACLYSMLRESPPEYISRWQDGAEGERSTAKILEPLRSEGYLIRHDLQTLKGNWDHVIVAPTAVYVLDSKNLGGKLVVNPNGVWVQRGDADDNYDYRVGNLTNGAEQAGRHLHSLIRERTGVSVWVQSVVVVWGDFPQGTIVSGKSVFVRGDLLVGWLRSRSTKLPADKFRAGVATLTHMRPAGSIRRRRPDWAGV